MHIQLKWYKFVKLMVYSRFIVHTAADFYGFFYEVCLVCNKDFGVPASITIRFIFLYGAITHGFKRVNNFLIFFCSFLKLKLSR